MSTNITLGKARLFTFAASAAGVTDTTTPATVDPSNPAVIRVTMNPSNPRQFAVVALSVGTTNANVHVGSITAHALVNVVAAAAPPVDTVTIDELGVGPEIDPSTIPWA